MDFEANQLLKLILVVVVIVIVALVVVTFLPQNQLVAAISRAELPLLTSEDLPCMLSCYTSLGGDEEIIYSDSSFLKVQDTSDVITFFPCNEHLILAATLALENARWKNPIFPWPMETRCYRDALLTELGFGQRWGIPWGFSDNIQDDDEGHCFLDEQTDELSEIGLSQQERAVTVMYDCLTGDFNCASSFSKWHWGMSDFCLADDHLKGFHNIPCWSSINLNDLVNPENFRYDYRSGEDINNYFRCSDRAYSLCYESKQYDDDCLPSWGLLDRIDPDNGGQIYTPVNGRCEDFTILQYSLFRAIGVPVNDLSLNIQYCDLPCPCKKLFNECEFSVEISNCFSQSTLNVPGKDSINGCTSGKTQNYPPEFSGSFKVEAYEGLNHYLFYVEQRQDVSEDNFCHYDYSLTLDGDYSNDYRTALFSTDNVVSLNPETDASYLGDAACNNLKESVISSLVSGESCDSVKNSEWGQDYACGCLVNSDFGRGLSNALLEYADEFDTVKSCFIRSLDCDPCRFYGENDLLVLAGQCDYFLSEQGIAVETESGVEYGLTITGLIEQGICD